MLAARRGSPIQQGHSEQRPKQQVVRPHPIPGPNHPCLRNHRRHHAPTPARGTKPRPAAATETPHRSPRTAAQPDYPRCCRDGNNTRFVSAPSPHIPAKQEHTGNKIPRVHTGFRTANTPAHNRTASVRSVTKASRLCALPSPRVVGGGGLPFTEAGFAYLTTPARARCRRPRGCASGGAQRGASGGSHRGEPQQPRQRSRAGCAGQPRLPPSLSPWKTRCYV